MSVGYSCRPQPANSERGTSPKTVWLGVYVRSTLEICPSHGDADRRRSYPRSSTHSCAAREGERAESACAHTLYAPHDTQPRTHDTQPNLSLRLRAISLLVVKKLCSRRVKVSPPGRPRSSATWSRMRLSSACACSVAASICCCAHHESDRAAQATHRKCTYRERHVVFEGEGGGRRVLRVDLDVRWEVDLAVARRQGAAGRALGIVLVVAASSQHTHTRITARNTRPTTRHTTHDTALG